MKGISEWVPDIFNTHHPPTPGNVRPYHKFKKGGMGGSGYRYYKLLRGNLQEDLGQSVLLIILLFRLHISIQHVTNFNEFYKDEVFVRIVIGFYKFLSYKSLLREML
jgi:hypothetical protein